MLPIKPKFFRNWVSYITCNNISNVTLIYVKAMLKLILATPNHAQVQVRKCLFFDGVIGGSNFAIDLFFESES